MRALLAISLALGLTGCGSKPSVDEKNVSVEQVAQKVRSASNDKGLVNPGKWLSSVTIEEMSMPGLPPQAADQMKRMVAKTHQSESCLTPEEARQPKENFFSGNENCRYDHFRMGDGKIDAQMQCKQEGATQLMQMTGTYSPDSYTMHMTSTTNGGQSSEENIAMKMKVEAKRIGKCSGEQA